MRTSNFCHAGNIGDVWAAIPVMREFYRKTEKKIILYLKKDVPAKYYDDANHPTKNKDGQLVSLNEKGIEMMKPLLLAQPFIEDVRIWTDEKINIDLDRIRESDVGMPGLSINRWYFYTWPDLNCDLSEVWLYVPDTEVDYAKGKIMITRSERYRNEKLNYEFLKPYEDECLFCGTMREYNNFCMTYDLNIRKFHIDNFLQLAQAIKQCKFHITNQTQAFQLSEGQKIPRILETCTYAPNCIPIGKNAHDTLSQYGLEYAFHELYGHGAEYIAEQEKSLLDKKKAESVVINE